MNEPTARPQDSSTRPALARVVVGSLIHATMMTLAFPPFDLWWLILLAPAPLVIAATAPLRFRWIAIIVFLPMVGTWLVHQWWVREISAAGLLPMAAYLAAWSPLLAWAIGRLARSPRFAGWPLALLVPIAWTGIEFLRATVAMEGYPWYLLGQPLIEWLPLAQLADVGGITLLAILPAALGGLAADAFLGRGTTRTRTIAGLATMAMLVAWIGYGFARIRPIGDGEDGPRILAMQTNLPQSNKVAWPPKEQWESAVGFAEATITAFRETTAAGGSIDLVAWPETMLPGVGLEPESTGTMTEAGWWPGNRFVELAVELQTILGVPLLVGSPAFDGLRIDGEGEQGRLEWDRRFNSVYILDERGPEAAARYDKIFLTPFGERMPYISEWPWLEQQLLDLGAQGMSFDLAAGDAPERLRFASAQGGPVSIGTPICFEDTVPSVCRSLVWDGSSKIASVLVNASNDGWFGSSMGPRSSHLQLARFRAIENRVPLVRVVNTGTTASIDSSGRIRRQCPPLEQNWLVASTELDERGALFARIGQWPSGLIAAACGLLLLAARGSRSDATSRNP